MFLQTFTKIWIEIFQCSNLHNYAHQKKRTNARSKGLLMGFHFAQVSPCRQAPASLDFSFLFRYRRFAAVPHFAHTAPRGLDVITGYYWGLLHKYLSWNVRGCSVLLVKGFSENRISPKTILEKYNHFLSKRKHFLSFWDTFIFPNGCAIQINPGTKERLKQNCAREHRLKAKFEKKLKETVGCFKVPLC